MAAWARVSKAAGRRLGKVCDWWFPILLRHGEGTMWWCRHNIGIVNLSPAGCADFKERHEEKVQRLHHEARLISICGSFTYRGDIVNPGPGWYCEHGFLVGSLTPHGLDNLVGWHANYLKDKEELWHS